MMKKIFFILTIFLLTIQITFAKENQKISQGQYVFEDGKFVMLSTNGQGRRYDHPIALRVQPLSTLGITTSYITSIMISAAGKWIVTFRVEAENHPFDVTFQLANGDIWTLYTVNPMNSMQPSNPLNLKVISISNNCIEVKVLD